MEKYKSGVEFEYPQYGGAGNKIFPDIAAYLNSQKASDYFETKDAGIEEYEEPSDLDEILATCTFKKADETGLDEDGPEPFYTDTIPEEEIFYLWRRIYPLREEDERNPLPESITDSVLMDKKNWAEAA